MSLRVPDDTDWLELTLNKPAHPDLQLAGVIDHFSLVVDRMRSVWRSCIFDGYEAHECTSTQAGRDGKTQLDRYDSKQTRVELMEFEPAMVPFAAGRWHS